jgi:DNA-binding transcriptional ArsR family regulator
MINKAILKECHEEGFNEGELYDSYKLFFGTLVSEPRLKIINLLRKGKKNVSEVMEELKMDQTSLSHNLARLKKCGFVNVEIDGKFRYYKLNDGSIKPLMEIIEKHMSKHCVHILRAMNAGGKDE